MKKIYTENAPAAIGPYSQAYISNGTVYCSGQIGIDPKTGNVVGGGIKEQTEQVLKNIEAVLAAAGTGFDRVTKTTCFLSDMSLFADFNAVYATKFVSLPARSCVAVKGLPKGADIEIEVIAEV